MLVEERAACLPLEDIESLDEALFSHGNDEKRAVAAVHSAMSTITSSVDGDLDAIKTLDALDEFEKSLLTGTAGRCSAACGAERRETDFAPAILLYRRLWKAVRS